VQLGPAHRSRADDPDHDDDRDDDRDPGNQPAESTKEQLVMTATETATETATQPAQPVLTLSGEAITKVAQLIADEASDEQLGLRVAVKAGGCSGFSYEMFFDPETNPDDNVTTFGTVLVKVDAASAEHLTGATLNYSDGIQGAGFSVENPNAQRSCGCGQSFS
jgi:iron-sulfur cluster assembly accessory protein